MARVQPITSKLAYEIIMREGAREGMYKKIITALEVIGEGSSYDIAKHLGVKPDKVWKRASELKKDEVIIDTGKMGLSPDGNAAIIYALEKDKSKYKDVPKVERQEKITTVDYANVLIAKGKKLVQPELF